MSCARPANRFSRKSPAVAGLFSWLCPASFSLLSYSAFFSLSCSALSRTSTDTRHLLTIYTQKAARFDKGSCHSQYCGQAGNSLSYSALSRTSLSLIAGSSPAMTVLFSSVILGQAQRVPGISGYSGHTLSVTLRLDVRGKPEHDRKKNKHGNDNIFFLCLTFNIVAFFWDKNKDSSIIGRQKNL